MTPNAPLLSLRKRDYGFVAGLTLFGAGLLWVSIFRHGPGVSYDTAQYFYCANSLVRGGGFQTPGGIPFRLYPPLYVLMLVPGILMNVALPHFVMVLNVASHAGIVLAAGFLFRLILHNRILFYASVSLMAVSYPLLWIGSWALADAPFMLMVVSGFYFALRLASGEARFRDLLLSASLLGLAVVQRYAGAPLLALPILAIATNRSWLSHPWRWTLISAVLSVFPLAVWLSYGAITGSSGLGHAESRTPWLASLLSTLHTLHFWSNHMMVVWVALGVLILARYRSVRVGVGELQCRAAVLAFAFIILYLGFILSLVAIVHIEKPRDRYLAPLYLPGSVLLFIGLDVLLRTGSKYVRMAAWIALALITLSQIDLASKRVSEGLIASKGGATYLPGKSHRDYSTEHFRNGPVSRALRALDRSGAAVLCSVPQAVYLTSGVEIPEGGYLHPEDADLESVLQELPGDRPVYFVWIHDSALKPSFLEKILSQGTFRIVVSDEFATMYRLAGRPAAA